MKFTVRILEGVSPELYLAVGRLVLSPRFLRENNNYPYKSSRMFIWHVLYSKGKVVAFMPVEKKLDSGYKIDNYYATSDRERGNQLLKLLKSVVREMGDETSPSLRATVQKRDAGIFKYMNFITIRETKLYVMMELVRIGSDSGKQDG
ncbi:hypothetical protein [Bacteroides thetaiotaomicron]|uniref:hypothetical protein n=1 Tax=Bacteroides thetaiotaomicron TaxID=818 RepID=UPI00356432C3